MKKTRTILILLLFFPILSFAQEYKTVTLIEQRSYYLNGGARAALGGKSRVVVKIDLPPNTKKWYYSFTTTPGEDGTELLNLGIQVGAALSTSGLSSAVASKIEVPSGSGSADVLVLPTEYRDIFLNKVDEKLRFYPDVSLQNTKQAAQSIDGEFGKSFYLGLRNPSSMSGINITLEVVAIVEEINTELDKANMFSTLGWKAYERGELDKCIELSKKALEYDPNHSISKFNIAFIHLLKDEDIAIEEYINAISGIKKEPLAKQILIAAIKDISSIKESKPNLKYLNDIDELLKSELNKL
jgi:tetratricopeptide (TPR) repeat protein